MTDFEATFASDLRFYLNGRAVVLYDVDPTVLLVDWLRSPAVGLTGTKKSCAQGGCGACTVMLSEWDAGAKRATYRSVNSCLRPLASLDGMEITTTEGTGSTRTALSPVQYRVAKENGSQCGFCTPGFVMNMHAFLAAHRGRELTQKAIEDAFDGSLCRCTGYRALLYGMRHFATGWGPKDEEGCLHTLVDPAEAVPHARTVKPTFPAALKKPPRAVQYRKDGYEWYRPLTLADVHEILRQHADPASVRLVVGNTSIGIYDRFVENPRLFVDVSHVPELGGVRATADGLEIGAAVTYHELLEELTAVRRKAKPEWRAGIDALHDMAHRTAGAIVRNAASLAGNTMLVVRHVEQGEPFPSDLFTALASLGTIVHVSVGAEGIRELPILAFAEEYQRSSRLREEAVLVRYRVPWTRAREHARTFKTALRESNAHSIVNAGLRVRLSADATVEEAHLVYGGVGPVAFHARSAEAILQGRAWSAKTLAAALARVREDVEANLRRHRARMRGLPYEGFSDAYKLALAESYFYQFFVHVATQVAPRSVPPAVRSAGVRAPRPVSGGKQEYEKYPGEYPVNLPYIKLSAFLQASGEAIYTQDIALPERGLEAAAVTSMQALATISYRIPDKGGNQPASIDRLIAYVKSRYPEFVDYVTARDVPKRGNNVAGAGGDTVFADGQVTCYGQLIGLVLATTEGAAIDIAQLVATHGVAYQTQDPILTIAEARRRGSIFEDCPGGAPYPVHVWKVIRPGSAFDWTEAEDTAEVSGIPCRVVRGHQQSGAQLHFYMETQACVAVPGEGNEIVVHPSSQSPDSIHGGVAKALGIPANHVDVRIQRVGGGYGGKTTRSPFVASATAVAAWKHRRPVRLAVRRENDSAMIGHRHPLYGEYAVAIATGEDNPDHRGRLMGMKTEFWSDGGNTYDCSFVVMDCIQLRCDSAYMVPNWQTTGDVCRTNKASNGAMRSMGLIQAMLIQEDAIERAAHAIGMRPDDVREKNLYQLGGLTPFGQVLDYCYMSDVWKRLKKTARVEARLAAVKKFNAENRWKKRGLSMIPVKYGSGYNTTFLEQAGALVEVYSQDGTVLVQQGGVEIGQGLTIKVAQIAAKALNVPIALIEVAPTDTRVVPNPISTGASTGTAFNGGAVQEACTQLRKRLENYCLDLLKQHGPEWCKGHGINFWDYADGWRTTLKGNTKPMWSTIVALAYDDRVDLSAQVRFQQPGGTAIDTGLHFKPVVVERKAQEVVNHFTGFTYSAACTEVEIDVLTGETTVLRADLLYDMGKSLNPAIDIGQVEGAYVQGLGYVLSEDVVFQPDGPAKGALNADNTWRYKVPATTSIPIELNVDLFPRKDAPEVPENPYDLYSSKEVGEPPLVLAITAYFALKHAVLAARQDRGHDCWFVLEAPATVQRVREACLVSVADLRL